MWKNCQSTQYVYTNWCRYSWPWSAFFCYWIHYQNITFSWTFESLPQVALKYCWTIVVLQSSKTYLTKHWLHKYMHFLLRHRMIQRCLSKVYLIPSGKFCFTNIINMLFTSNMAIKKLIFTLNSSYLNRISISCILRH